MKASAYLTTAGLRLDEPQGVSGTEHDEAPDCVLEDVSSLVLVVSPMEPGPDLQQHPGTILARMIQRLERGHRERHRCFFLPVQMA
jgi:hypothetical protein